MTRPALLFYCHHSLGLGHLVRSLALAEELASRFRVVFLSGGTAPAGRTWPTGVEVVHLPPLVMQANRQLAGSNGADTDAALAERRALILRTFDEVAPRVVLVELFPFGRRRLAGEIIALLDRVAQCGDARPVVATSVRDILVRGRSSQQPRDNAAAVLADRHLDAVLVHGDPAFAAFEDFFRPNVRWAVPVYHTGFVVPSPSARRNEGESGGRERHVVVSVGGGRVGEDLARAAIAAQRELRADGFSMSVMAGPLAPEDIWERLSRDAAGVPGLDLRRQADDLVPELRRAAVSVSQCGYNTSLDIIAARVPALVVPFMAPKEDEQVERARRMESMGLARLLHPDRATASRLAAEVRSLAGTVPPAVDLNLDGARRSAEILSELVEQRRCKARRAPARRAHRGWLAPVARALDEAAEPVTWFFRDDDAGWDDPRLRALVSTFARREAPIDLAVIPQALEPPLARELATLWDAGTVRLHQHGLSHRNHEPEGRACEFGPHRDEATQRRDVEAGRDRLLSLLGPRLDPIFTPPWNRCTADTGRILASLGLALSRESRARALDVPGLVELPVSVDWLKKRDGRRLSREEIGALMARAVRGGGPVGVMFHHAEMDARDVAQAGRMLDLLQKHSGAEWRPMREIAGQGRVLLVRHGHTAWNGVRHMGWTDVPLDEVGCRQAQDVARSLASARVDAIYTSPLSRARQTAAPLAKEHGVTPVVLDDLRELRFGDLEGQPRDPTLKVRRRHVHDPLPGGESLADLFRRASRFAERLRHDTEAGRHVVVVGHRRMNTVLLSVLEGAQTVEEAIAREGYSPANGSIHDIRLTYTHDGKALTWTRPFETAGR
jgi:predicted glycosyltransferase/broad specificity phosphatase PhoE/peptidoglycan/xylan/chitin deacetylase (PgdA/CDA1 family)